MNVAYRWFLGYLMNEQIPHFSTISYNFKRRYTEQTIEEIFYWILKGDPKITEKIKKGRKGPQQQESAPHNGNFGAYRDADIYDKPVCRRRLQGIHAGGGTVAHHGHRRCGTGKLLAADTGQQQEMLKAPQSMRSFFLTFGSMHSIISYTNHTNYTEMII